MDTHSGLPELAPHYPGLTRAVDDVLASRRSRLGQRISEWRTELARTLGVGWTIDAIEVVPVNAGDLAAIRANSLNPRSPLADLPDDFIGHVVATELTHAGERRQPHVLAIADDDPKFRNFTREALEYFDEVFHSHSRPVAVRRPSLQHGGRHRRALGKRSARTRGSRRATSRSAGGGSSGSDPDLSDPDGAAPLRGESDGADRLLAGGRR